MTNINSFISAKHISAFVMGVAMFFAVAAAAHAEESNGDLIPEPSPFPGVDCNSGFTDCVTHKTQNAATLSSLKERLQILRQQLKGQQEDNRNRQQELKNQRQQAQEAKRDENKLQRKEDRQAFLQSIENLSGEERKAALAKYVEELRAVAAQRKAQIEVGREQRKAMNESKRETFKTESEAFRTSLEGLSLQEKLQAVMARFNDLQARAADRGMRIEERINSVWSNGDDNTDSENEAEDESENEVEDDSNELPDETGMVPVGN